MYSVVGARGEARDGPERVRRLLRVERAGARLSLDRGEEGMEQLCELLRVEFGGMRFGRAFDGGDERVRGVEFPDAEFPARVQQAGELPALDVPGVVPHEAGRGGEERRDVWITPFARHEPPPVGRPRDAAQRGAAVHDVELRHRAAHDREHVRCERASRELCVDLHLPLAHDDAGFRTKRTRPRYPDSLSRARRRDHHRVPPPPPSRSRIVSAVY